MRPGAIEAWPTEPVSLDRFRALLTEEHPDLAWRPLPLLADPGEAADLRALCESRGIQRLDTLDRQLAELAKTRFPGRAQAAERETFLAESRPGGSAPRPGAWMYLHWSRRLVRVLDREDYFEVITSRNRDKITRAEQVRLRDRTIGVVGLSVGGEIAVTLAQEHLCGRIRVADFDELDLSNLNRLASGIDDLGVNKAHLVARRIAVLDPWLGVEAFSEGLTEGNAEAFLEGLDLIVDECDSLALKFHLRTMAKARGLNLLFAADERGMISVEPYGHSDMAPFHGIVEAPHGRRESYETDEAFFRALADWLGGWDRISERSRRSLPRIGKELAGYPQLAGEPRYAAGQVAHMARRLLLGEELPPCLLFQDLEEAIPAR